MTEASNATSEASKLNDLSHQDTVPSPKTNSPTSNSSTISDSRHLSMREDSENSTQSQTKIESIVDEIESIKARNICDDVFVKSCYFFIIFEKIILESPIIPDGISPCFQDLSIP